MHNVVKKTILNAFLPYFSSISWSFFYDCTKVGKLNQNSFNYQSTFNGNHRIERRRRRRETKKSYSTTHKRNVDAYRLTYVMHTLPAARQLASRLGQETIVTS